MSQKWKILCGVVGIYLVLSFLHVWLNIGFVNLGIVKTEASEKSFRVGFLPVT